jgi:apolipoprotein N-acyltransferase
MFMVTAYTVSMVYGDLVSLAVQFYRVPFILQPISIFGYGMFEALVFFTSTVLAWWIGVGYENRKLVPPMKPILKNPLVILVSIWVLWISMAGIITATHMSVGKVKVATVNMYNRNPNIVDGVMYARPDLENLAINIVDAIKTTGAKFVVAPEFSLYASSGSETCEEQISKYIYPRLVGLDAYVTIGCINMHRNDKCYMDNMSYTIDPSGHIINVYGKMNPTPGELSCNRPGITVNTVPAVLDDVDDHLKFSAVICYDVDYIGPIATAADGGAALILNPANDWSQVRHHYSVAVIRAIENRVAIVKAERNTDAVIVDPFGKIVALGHSAKSNNLFAEVSVSTPLKIGWIRQHMAYWIFTAIYTVLTSIDIYNSIRKHRQM